VHDGLETSEKLFQQAQQFLKEGRPSDAFQAFSSLIERRKDSPESHLEIGRLYLSLHDDPLFAIYHFRQYLLLAPKGPLSAVALQLIETAKKEFVHSLPFGNLTQDSSEYMNLVEVLNQVRQENSQLRQENKELKRHMVTLTTREPVAPIPESLPPAAIGTYVVKEGDTLDKISLKFYGTSQKWPRILEANKDIIDSPKRLRIGTELKIPSASE
jgi:nucleoid-associated protein YgaU